MSRGLLLGGGAACVFVIVAFVLLQIMPQPLRPPDYLVIGSVATLVALLVLFLLIVFGGQKGGDVFFKRRKKK